METPSIFDQPLSDLILSHTSRRIILRELHSTLTELDREIEKRCNDYLSDPSKMDESSMLYQTARNYASANLSRRPLIVALKTIEAVLGNPNFLREYYIILVIFVQFKDVVKSHVAPHTLEPVFRRYFNDFYFRFQTFTPGSKKMQTAEQFIQAEFSLLLTAISIMRTQPSIFDQGGEPQVRGQ